MLTDLPAQTFGTIAHYLQQDDVLNLRVNRSLADTLADTPWERVYVQNSVNGVETAHRLFRFAQHITIGGKAPPEAIFFSWSSRIIFPCLKTLDLRPGILAACLIDSALPFSAVTAEPSALAFLPTNKTIDTLTVLLQHKTFVDVPVRARRCVFLPSQPKLFAHLDGCRFAHPPESVEIHCGFHCMGWLAQTQVVLKEGAAPFYDEHYLLDYAHKLNTLDYRFRSAEALLQAVQQFGKDTIFDPIRTKVPYDISCDEMSALLDLLQPDPAHLVFTFDTPQTLDTFARAHGGHHLQLIRTADLSVGVIVRNYFIVHFLHKCPNLKRLTLRSEGAISTARIF